jgi:hypothetical protein
VKHHKQHQHSIYAIIPFVEILFVCDRHYFGLHGMQDLITATMLT